MTPNELINEAKKVIGVFRLSKESLTAGSVAAALVTKSQKVYTGICIDLDCGIGICAEHSAIAEMLKDRETEIEMIVAVGLDKIYPPCGRCREMMYQINNENKNTKVVVDQNTVVKLDELLPYRLM
jgi:cytidine deaminase